MIVIYTLTAIALIYTLIGVYTDIKWRIFPDYFSYSMIVFGVFGNLILSLQTQNSLFFANSVLFLIVTFFLGYVFSYLGMWGMGDTKILAGYAAIFSVWPIFYLYPISIAPWPFVLTIWLNAILIAPVLAAIFILFNIVKKRNLLLPKIQEKLKSKRKITYLLSALLVLFFFSYVINKPLGAILLVVWAFAAVLFYLFLLAKIMDKHNYELKKPSNLIEGDYPLELKIKIPGKLKKWGLEQNQIQAIISKTKKPLKIKLGFPMIAAYGISLIVSLIFGDLLYKIMISLIYVM